MTGNKQVIVRELPKGRLTQENFEVREGETPKIGDGEVLGRTILMSIDAANRAWMQGATYRGRRTESAHRLVPNPPLRRCDVPYQH